MPSAQISEPERAKDPFLVLPVSANADNPSPDGLPHSCRLRNSALTRSRYTNNDAHCFSRASCRGSFAWGNRLPAELEAKVGSACHLRRLAACSACSPLAHSRLASLRADHFRFAKSPAIPAAAAIYNAPLYEYAIIYSTELESNVKKLNETQRAPEESQRRSSESSHN